jgi:hypothetical protein
LNKRPPPWNKGHTKDSHPSLEKISKERRKKDNFAKWRENARKKGLIPKEYPPFNKSSDLAFLVGLVLGDGHIQKFPRTERLIISLGTDKPELITYSKNLTRNIFSKSPTVVKVKNINMVRIELYQKYISKRLKIPTGSRRRIKISFPSWIWTKHEYLICALKGLFEADGSLSIHEPTYTYNFQFSNNNPSLLSEVEKGLRKLHLNPEVRSYAIRLRKKKEVKYFEELINFRKYSAG